MRFSPPWTVLAILAAGLTTTVLLVPDTNLNGSQVSTKSDAKYIRSWIWDFEPKNEFKELRDED